MVVDLAAGTTSRRYAVSNPVSEQQTRSVRAPVETKWRHRRPQNRRGSDRSDFETVLLCRRLRLVLLDGAKSMFSVECRGRPRQRKARAAR